MKSAKAKLIIIKLVIERSSFVQIIDPIIRMLPKKPPKTPKHSRTKYVMNSAKFLLKSIMSIFSVILAVLFMFNIF